MDHTTSHAQLDTALEPVRQQLRADGYDLRARIADENMLEVQVVAGDEACEDCLVPRAVFATMLSEELASAGIAVAGVDVAYPADD